MAYITVTVAGVVEARYERDDGTTIRVVCDVDEDFHHYLCGIDLESGVPWIEGVTLAGSCVRLEPRSVAEFPTPPEEEET